MLVARCSRAVNEREFDGQQLRTGPRTSLLAELLPLAARSATRLAELTQSGDSAAHQLQAAEFAFLSSDNPRRCHGTSRSRQTDKALSVLE